MKQLDKVLTNTTWAKASNAINLNNDALYVAVTALEHAAFKHKGYFKTVALLQEAYPTAEEGSQAFVYNSANPTTASYDIYTWTNAGWQDSGVNGGNVDVNLDDKQDTLVGYSETVSNGKATQIAIEGDTIALGGKVSIGQINNIETAILMSSAQASNAETTANTVKGEVSLLKQPVKPLHLNANGKLELSIGQGLYVSDGKLCANMAAGGSGSGGGTVYSEGAGISISNNKISVAYNMETLGIDSCGGLTVNYGEGLTVKNGKLSATNIVTAGDGLVKNGEELSVNAADGLQYGSDGELKVKTGKGLSVDNNGAVNVNTDNSTILANSDGTLYVNKSMLAGNGLRVLLNRLAVNYGTGLTSDIATGKIYVNYGDGLQSCDGQLTLATGNGLVIDNGKVRVNTDDNTIKVDGNGRLYSTVQSKTYTAGDAISVVGNAINVKYDGVTLSTKDTLDNSLHVMLGGGLKQGSSGIEVAVGSGLAIGNDNKLYATVEGKTYTAGNGVTISSSNVISVNSSITNDIATNKNNITTLQTAVSKKQNWLTAGCGISLCGDIATILYGSGLTMYNNHLEINQWDIVKSGGGLRIDCGALAVKLGNGLTIDSCSVVVNHGTGLAVSGGKLYSTLTFGSGLEQSGNNVTLANSVNTDINNLKTGKQDKLTAGSGVSISSGNAISVNYGTGLAVSGGKLYSTVTTYTGGHAVKVSDNEISVKYDGVTISTNDTSDGSLHVVLGSGLKQGTSGVEVAYGSGLSMGSDGKLYSTVQSKTYTAGDGIEMNGNKISVKYGSGLKVESSGYLQVDAENLTVGNASKLGGVSSDSYPRQALLYESGNSQYFVVLLCKYGNGLTYTYHRLSGRIYSVGYGFARYVAADVDIFVSDWNEGMDKYLRFDSYGFKEMDLVTCNYGGVKYLAIRHCVGLAKTVYFEGTSTNVLLTPIKYFTANTNTVNNAEIYGSITVVSASQPSSNGNKYALVSDTVARATADANGNNIASTYQTKLTFGSGLEQSGNNVTLANSVNTDIGNLKTGKQDKLTAGSGVSISSGNAISVNYGTALGISNSKVYLKYSTSYLSLDSSGFLTIDIARLKTALGL